MGIAANFEKIVVRGPAVAGGETALGVVGKIRGDHTLAYI